MIKSHEKKRVASLQIASLRHSLPFPASTDSYTDSCK